MSRTSTQAAAFDQPMQGPHRPSPVLRPRRILLVMALIGFGGCSTAPSGPSVEPPTPLSNVTPDMLNPDGTLRRNGLAPVDPSEQI